MKFKSFTIASTAFQPCENIRENADRIINETNKLKKDNPNIDLVVFCELALNKYIKLLSDEEYISKCAVSLESEIIADLKQCAKESMINLSVGFTEEKEGKYYNSQLLVGRDGEIISIHRKCNLTSEESKLMEKGENTITFCDLEGLIVGTALCYDLFMSKLLKKTQPHLLIHSLTDPGAPRFSIGAVGRFNNGFYVSANRFGLEKEKKYLGRYNGHIGVVGPMGRIIELKYGQEDAIVRELKIRLNPSKILMVIRNVSSKLLIGFNVVTHMGKVFNYLKWHFKQK